MIKRIPPHGLNVTPDDNRDFKLGALVKLPDPRSLPIEFWNPPITIYDQLKDSADDFCSACSTSGMSGIQEEVPLFYQFSFALGKYLSGDPAAFGQDIRTAMKAHTKFGALQQSDAPAALAAMNVDDWRYLQKYPNEVSLQHCALKNIKKTFFKVTGPYDHYDNIRSTIYAFKDKKYTVGTGVRFGWDLGQYVLDTVPADGSGHMMFFAGHDNDGLVTVNSCGTDAGKGGMHRMTRDVVNKFVEQYGAYTFIDVDRDEAEYYMNNGIQLGDNWVVQFLKSLTSWFHPAQA